MHALHAPNCRCGPTAERLAMPQEYSFNAEDVARAAQANLQAYFNPPQQAMVPFDGGAEETGQEDSLEEEDEEDEEDEEAAVKDAARAFAQEASTAQALAGAHLTGNSVYQQARDTQLLEVRTRQLKALQQDYLRLHEHTLQQAQQFAEEQQAAALQVQRAEASREVMRKQLAEARGRASNAKPAMTDALAKCEKMLGRLASVRSVEQLPHEMAAASAMLFEARTLMLQAQAALTEPEGGGASAGGGGSADAPKLESVFNRADTNRDRRLDRKEFRVLMSKHGGSTKEADTLFTAIDRDKSGAIDYKEFQRAAKGGKLGSISQKDWNGGGGTSGTTQGGPGSGSRAGTAGTGPPRREKPAAATTRSGVSTARSSSDPPRRSSGIPQPTKVRGPASAKAARETGSDAAAGGGGSGVAGAGDPFEQYQQAPPPPMPAGGVLHAASAFPSAYQQMHPSYMQQVQQAVQGAYHAQMQAALAHQQAQSYPWNFPGVPGQHT